METANTDAETPDGPMRCFLVRPDAAPRGAVIVVQEAFGLNAHIEDVTGRFAAEGYLAIAPELYHRSPMPRVAEYGRFPDAAALMRRIDDQTLGTDLDATLALAADAGFDAARVGIVGFCMGGRVTFLAALRHVLGAAVGFYGGGIVRQRREGFAALAGLAATLRTPWLGLFGDADTSIPVEDVERLRAALAGAPVDHEIVRYPGAAHGFFCEIRDSYAPAAAADGWARTLAWLEQHLAGT